MNLIKLIFIEPINKASYYLYRVITLVTAVLLVYGCTSSPTVLNVTKNPNSTSNVFHPSYKDIWSALGSLQTDMEALRQFSPDNEVHQFTIGLQYIKEGKIQEAENIFKLLSETAQDKLIREHSGKIYSNLLFNESKFQESYQFLQNFPADDSIVKGGSYLINAFRQMPSEKYRYPEIPIKLPLSVSKIDTPVIEIKVNGKIFNFWIDSGAGLSVLSSDVAVACSVQPIGEETTSAGTATNIRVTAHPAIIESLDIGGLLINNHPAIIIAKSDLEFKLLGLFTMVKIDGIVGWNAIRNMHLEIDYATKEVKRSKYFETNT